MIRILTALAPDVQPCRLNHRTTRQGRKPARNWNSATMPSAKRVPCSRVPCHEKKACWSPRTSAWPACSMTWSATGTASCVAPLRSPVCASRVRFPCMTSSAAWACCARHWDCRRAASGGTGLLSSVLSDEDNLTARKLIKLTGKNLV